MINTLSSRVQITRQSPTRSLSLPPSDALTFAESRGA